MKRNQILVMITIVIINKALCFHKFELFLSHDDSIAESEYINTNDISGSYVCNI